MKHKPIVPWIGGKSRLAKQILPLYPEHTCYCEPFAGGAALLFLKEPSKVEVLNDINSELVNLYRVVQNHLEEFIRQFKWALSSREVFKWMQMKHPETLTDIQKAARFFYLQKLAFGGKVQGQNFGTATTSPPALNLLRLEEDLSQAHLRLSRVFVENLLWQDVIKKYDREHTLFFCDPPYYQTEGYGVDFELDNYFQLAEFAKTIKGKMIITVNSCKEMSDIFSGFNIRKTQIKYSLSKSKKYKITGELIISNF